MREKAENNRHADMDKAAKFGIMESPKAKEETHTAISQAKLKIDFHVKNKKILYRNE